MPFVQSHAPSQLQSVSLDAFAAGLAERGAPGESAALFRWSDQPSVHLLRFPDRGAQAAALTRLSLFLEDAALRGVVASTLPTGKRGGAAAYSGHNCRLIDAARFFDAAVSSLSPAEEALRTLLCSARLLTRTASGNHAAQPTASVLALPRGLPRAEASSTLLHEAMHGLFYASPSFAAAVARFWRDAMSEQQRDTWRSFLAGLGYDASDEELSINELQAYMATESELFGCAVGGGKAKRRGGGLSPAAEHELAAIQITFEAALAAHVPRPLPRLQNAECVCWAANGGPLRLPG